jgi:hypothetical protein
MPQGRETTRRADLDPGLLQALFSVGMFGTGALSLEKLPRDDTFAAGCSNERVQHNLLCVSFWSSWI